MDLKPMIKSIIDSFLKSGPVFSNEQQFQFALAWSLKELIDDCEIILEQPIFLMEKDVVVEKMYIDIVVKYEGKYYPIELKYKTANKQIEYKDSDNNSYYTFNQGAVETGSYDFLWDIKRLERLAFKNKEGLEEEHIKFDKDGCHKRNKDSITVNYTSLGENPTFEKGYAIILTNNSGYDRIRKNQYYWSNFNLGRDREVNGKLCWLGGDDLNEVLTEYDENSRDWNRVKNNCGLARCKPIDLKGEYKLAWSEEIVPLNNSNNCNPFKYLIVEIIELEE